MSSEASGASPRRGRSRTHARPVKRVGAGWAVATPRIYVWDECRSEVAAWGRELILGDDDAPRRAHAGARIRTSR